jgi:type II secretory pathway pseudopilin PulG
MICSAKQHDNSLGNCATSGGFTILEIVIVLAIASLIVGSAITALISNSSERILTSASGELELLAKRARTTAILRQTPYAIEFHPGFVRLLPLSESVNSFTADSGFTDPAEEPPSRPSVREQIEIDPDITLSIRHWNTENTITPAEDLIPVWRFDPDGLSEPLTVIFSLGESYAQDTYHPLTATIAESELVAY